MKKILSLLLVLSMALGMIFIMPSCTDNKDDDNKIETTPVEIIKDGVAQYTLVYADSCSDPVFTAMIDLVQAVQKLTGVRLDYIKASKASENPDGKYIIIGSTTFEESDSAMESLPDKEDAFTIEKAGEHIVFVSHFDHGVTKAVKHYTDNQLSENYDATTKTLLLKEYWFDGTKEFIASFDVSNISQYTIVYSTAVDGFKEAAESIRDRIKLVTGKTLDVYKDTGISESAYEILVGKTNRYLSRKCYKDGTHLMEYKTVVEKGQLQIVCGGPHSAKLGAYALVDTVFKDSNATLSTGTHKKGDLTTESVAHKPGTDIRIMTANLLGQSNDSIKAGFALSSERIEIFAKILVDYTPDLVGVQEFDKYYNDSLSYYLDVVKNTYGIEYSTTQNKQGSKAICNFVIYRSDKYKLDYQRFELPSYISSTGSDPNYHSVMSSAKFTSIADPTEEVALISSHWHWEKEDNASIPPKQMIDANQMAAEYKAIQKAYPNARIFCTGDFNSHRFERKYFNQFLSDINGVKASDLALIKGTLIPSFQHMGQYIDHIVGAKNTFDVLYHAGTNNNSKQLTDHQPVYADISFLPISGNGGNNGGDNATVDPILAEIVKNGVSQYTLVYPDSCSNTVFSAIINMMTEIQLLTGARVNYATASSVKSNSTGKYILVGATTLPETQSALESLESNEDAFTIKKVGDHIVIAAHFDAGVTDAIKYFIDNQLKSNYDATTKTLTLKEYSYSGTKTFVSSFNVKDISKYTIVYSSAVDGFKEVAQNLRTLIQEATGITLDICKDTGTSESSYEILVGNTNRSLSRKCYKDGIRLMEYKVVVENGQLQIVCGGPYSAKLGASALIDTVFTGSSASLSEGTHLETNLATESVSHKYGTDIRIMTANLLAQSANSVSAGFPHSTARIEIFAKILVDYTPDIIGVQEVDGSFHDPINYYLKLIKDTYGIEYSTTAMNKNGSAVANFVIYRSDKYRLDYQKAELPSYANVYSSLYHSILTSAKFTSIADPSVEVALLSAHWHWETEAQANADPNDPPKQQIDAMQMAAEFKALQAQYPNARIFLTGDFNSHRFQRKYFNEMLDEINGEIASDIATANGVIIPSFQHYTPKQYIDHIISTDGSFDVLIHAGTNNHSAKLTDHQPVYADIVFK